MIIWYTFHYETKKNIICDKVLRVFKKIDIHDTECFKLRYGSRVLITLKNNFKKGV